VGSTSSFGDRLALLWRMTIKPAHLSLAHGVFNFTTGLWPVFHRRSFETVTGPKTDFWLVRTVGLLIATSGAVMGMAGWKKRVTPETRALGIGIAASLAAIDIIYVLKKRISPIYLIDAAVEIRFATAWLNGTEPEPRALIPAAPASAGQSIA